MKTNNLRKVETLIQPFNSLTLIVESESSRILVFVSQFFHVGPKRMDAYGVCPYHLPHSYAPHKLTIPFECDRLNWKSDDWMKIICLNNWQITFSKSLNCNLIWKFMAFYSCHYTNRIWFEFLFVEKKRFFGFTFVLPALNYSQSFVSGLDAVGSSSYIRAVWLLSLVVTSRHRQASDFGEYVWRFPSIWVEKKY